MLDSEVAGSSKDTQRIQTKPKTQLSSTGCKRREIVQGDEGPVGGVSQVLCHGVMVVVGHQEEGQEEEREKQGEVEGEVEESQGQPHIMDDMEMG